jgi:ssDNA thymidine ADP-ribosyltransferase DarT-like protein
MAAAPDPLARIPFLLHFTDQRNLPKIEEFGGLLATATLRQAEIDFFPGGDETSLALDTSSGMDAYVHLCFRGRHPMAHRVCERNPGVTLKYLRIDRSILYEPRVLFAPGVGYAQGVQPVPVQEACAQGMIDFEVLYTFMDWNIPDIWTRRQAAELCEILVPDHVALAVIQNMPNG